VRTVLSFGAFCGALLLAAAPAIALSIPTSADTQAWRAFSNSLPACGIARSIDDYDVNPKAVSDALQRRRIHAYVLCRAALHQAHAGARVGNVNAFLLGRACMIYGMQTGDAGSLPDCN